MTPPATATTSTASAATTGLGRRTLAAVTVLAMAVSACAGGTEIEGEGEAVVTSGTDATTGATDATATSPTTSDPSSSSSPEASPTTDGSTDSSATPPEPPPGETCTGGSAVVPTGATSGPVVDVDGDGRDDTAWIVTDTSGQTRVGIVTAAGGGAERRFESASPVTRRILVTEINDSSPVVVLADDGRTVQLWAFVDCALVDVTNKFGEPYEFSLGFSDIGTGVGCSTVNGQRELTGLDVTSETDTTVAWTSTVVDITGTEALNGKITSGTFDRPDDNAAIDLLHTVACGDQTITADGLEAPR